MENINKISEHNAENNGQAFEAVDFKNVLTKLKAPFPENVVKERMFGRDRQGNPIFVNYVSWADVADRLDEICPDWSYRVTYEIKEVAGVFMFIAKAFLTVNGITREGIGAYTVDAQHFSANFAETAIKSAEHDALKRAAVKFGVARYLYNEDGILGNGKPADAQPARPQRNNAYGHAPQASQNANNRAPQNFNNGERSDKVNEIEDLAARARIALNGKLLFALYDMPESTFAPVYEAARQGHWKKFFALYYEFTRQQTAQSELESDTIEEEDLVAF